MTTGFFYGIMSRGEFMANLNRYKFSFGNKNLTLTTKHDNLFMEEVERVTREKYEAIRERMPHADDETLAILLAINSLSTQLEREIEFDDKEQELEEFRKAALDKLKGKSNKEGNK